MIGEAIIEAEFAETHAGLLAGRVQDLAFLAVPVEAGLRVLTGWRLRAAMAAWTKGDFSGADGIVTDESAFRAHVEEIAQHRRELRDLGRWSEKADAQTPWGPAQSSEIYSEGVVFHSTASHGGFFLDPARNRGMQSALRNDDGWYEEDCEWSKVATAFIELFTAYERRLAEKTLRNSLPDAWEAYYGHVLDPAKSFEKERRQFLADHAADWVVIAASRSKDHQHMIEVGAKLGGVRDNSATRCFLVPDEEYAPGRHGFVIDLDRHEELRKG
ncbi:hypothetical protein [Sphingopyxis sp. JAI108]|uniref:DUF7007 domain-containing protein n=1 Tax=Sphingopyxis sp. JAI108 TaxID=2723060 RepID=UPI0015C924DD|nr:hypothetical protein [Sphingopyxis sp. JAI108]NYF33624.1 hypothetical protein [Sphingopyxis sp. JAI108]